MVGEGWSLFQVHVALTSRGPHETNTEIAHGYNGCDGFKRIGTPLGFRNQGNVFWRFHKSVLSVSSVVSVFYRGRRSSSRWCLPENATKAPCPHEPTIKLLVIALLILTAITPIIPTPTTITTNPRHHHSACLGSHSFFRPISKSQKITS